jgi:hypothetical protein
LGAHTPSPEEGAAAIGKLYFTKGGYTQDQVDEAGKQFLDLIHNEALKTISKVKGQKLQGQSSKLLNQAFTPDTKYRFPVKDEKGLHVEFNSPEPAFGQVWRQYAILLPKDAGGDDDIQLVLAGRGTNKGGSGAIKVEIALASRMDELVPSVSGVLQIRVGLFIDRIVGEMLTELKSLAAMSLRGQL